MWKMRQSLATGLILSSFLLAPAFAQETPEDTAEESSVGMMGGNCPMMMMGQAMGRGMGGMGPGGHRHGMMRGGGMGMGMGMMGGPRRMASMIEGRLAFLKAELDITEAQNEAWTAYADAVRGRAQAMQDMRQTMMTAMRSGTALERMDARIKGMETMLASLKEVKPATEKLYAQLTDDQKKIADQLIGMGCGAL